jgi:hypothetical protein
MAVRVTIEAGRAAARLFRSAVLGLVVLLLRERRHQKAQALDLLRWQNAVEQFVVIVDRNELALRDVAEIGALIEVHRRRKLGQEVIRDIVIDIEPREIAGFLAVDLVDRETRKHETTFLVLRVRQRKEAWREQISVANLLRCHAGEAVPGRSGGEFDSDTFLHRLRAIHRDARGGAIAEIVALIEKRHVLPLNRRLLRR